MLWHKLPKSIYFRRGSLPIALDEVITDTTNVRSS